jgi:threonine-phosphate decarboxylase
VTGHGGNIYKAAEKTGIPEDRIIDFSASINPMGTPASSVAAMKEHIRYLPHYPEPFAERLGLQIGKHYRVSPDSVLCANGSTELIYLIPRALKPRRVLLTAPAFSEYEKACKLAGHKTRVINYRLTKEENFDIDPNEFISAMSGTVNSSRITHHLSRPFDMAFLCNPNNPTGRLLNKRDVLRIADAANELGCFLVLDEAFMDFCPGASVLGEVGNYPFLIVLRSMTKFYALSGLRIGFGVFPQQILKRLKEYKEPWTVNTLAQEAARAALSDRAYQKATPKMIKAEKKFMEQQFKKLSLDYVPSAANFYLLRLESAKQVISALEQKGILVRDCSNFNGLDDTYVRVAVKSRRENEILIKELSALPYCSKREEEIQEKAS